MAKMESEAWVIRQQVDSQLAGLPDPMCVLSVGGLTWQT